MLLTLYNNFFLGRFID